MMYCFVNSTKDGMIYKPKSITDFSNTLYLGFKQFTPTNLASTNYIKYTNSEFIILYLHLLDEYPLITVRNIDTINNRKDLIIHELLHIYKIIVEKIMPVDEIAPKNKEEFIKYHNDEQEFEALLSKDTQKNFFDSCKKFLNLQPFEDHIECLTVENKERYFEEIKELLLVNQNINESEVVTDNDIKNFLEFIGKNIHLVAKQENGPLEPLNIPQKCLMMSKDEFKSWLINNKPELFNATK